MRKNAQTGSGLQAALAAALLASALTGAGAIASAAPRARHAPFKISRATTYLTAPVLPSGRVDYIAAINAWAKRGVTRKNNAGVLVARTIPAESIQSDYGDAFAARFYKLLGVPAPVAAGTYKSWSLYAKKHGLPTAHVDESATLPPTFIGSLSFKVPWTTTGHPRTAAYLHVNRRALALLMRASRRSQFYMPMLVATARPRMVANISLAAIGSENAEAALLVWRAMHSMGSGHGGKCARTLVAMFRLGALESRPPILVSFLVGGGEKFQAARATQALLNAGYFSVDQEKSIFRALRNLPRSGSMPTCVGIEGRFTMLDAIEHMAVGDWKMNVMTLGIPGQGDRAALVPTRKVQNYPGRGFFTNVRWNRVLKQANKLCDGVIRVLCKKTGAQRFADLKKIDARSWAHHMPIDPPPWVAHRVGTTAMMQDYFSSLFYQQLSWALAQQSSCELQIRLTKTALALAIYRAKKGKYPASLAALKPRYLKRVPTDPFDGNPLTYRFLAATAYVLYGDVPHGKNGSRRVEVRGGVKHG